MKILIDTNILIALEDHQVIEKSFSKFYRLAITNNCKVLYHPRAIPEDIERDRNVQRKQIIKSKLDKYEALKDHAIPTSNFLSNVINAKTNDKTDNKQLFQLYKDFVDIFLTQDKGIHKNAKKVKLEDKVLSIEKGLILLEEQFTFRIPTHPILREHSIREIETKFKFIF